MLRTAQSLFERLAPGDLVGLARLPTGVGNVEFTTDRKRVNDALLKVTGSVTNRVGMTKVNISEAWALENNDTSTWQQADRARMRRRDRARARSLRRHRRVRRPQPAERNELAHAHHAFPRSKAC